MEPAEEASRLVVDIRIRGTGDQHEFEFNVGETITFRVTSEGEAHTFTTQGLGVEQQIGAGETAEIKVQFLSPQKHQVRWTIHEGEGAETVITVRAMGI